MNLGFSSMNESNVMTPTITNSPRKVEKVVGGAFSLPITFRE